jgi:hypothetical protein
MKMMMMLITQPESNNLNWSSQSNIGQETPREI